MFKLKHLMWSLMLCLATFSTFSLTSCGSDSDDDECNPDFSSATASGTFMGDAFSVVQGTAKEDPFEATDFRFVLYGETVMGDACDGFNFDKPDSTIIFTLPMEVGVYDLGSNYTVSFNDASVVNQATADIALCGAVEIVAITATEVTGKIDATGADNSELNGTFTAALCP